MKRTLRRLAVMQGRELRFRLLCEARKTAGRVRQTLTTPGWSRAHLVSALSTAGGTVAWAGVQPALESRDYARAHQAMARHFLTRSTAFPLPADRVDGVAAGVARRFPDAPAEAAARADAILSGRYDLLGFKGLDLGPMPDWHYDGVSGRRSPQAYWASVPFLDAALGDHKVIWELNRHQHWLALGRAYALTGGTHYYDRFTSQLESWLNANPPLVGTNWASMLELALRSLTWMWSLELFVRGASPGDREPWLVDLLLALDRQLTHVEHNLSYYFSPNTHLSGEALALYVGGLALPELRASARRAALGRDVLVQEATRQIRADGGHAELSAHYHRYSTDFYLFATIVGRNAGDRAAEVFADAARRQARFLRTITDDQGMRPQIGDDDGGTLFPMCGRDPADCRDTLATAAAVLEEPALAIGRVPEETYWMCGTAAADALSPSGARWGSAALPASGYFVSRTVRGDQLILDAGPHGFLNGGHAHADALSCVLTVAGRPVLIDTGTATYTMDYEVRDHFRSTMMHNTIVLDGRSQSRPRGPFHWASRAAARHSLWRTSSDCDYVEGTHDGYLPRVHARSVLAVHGIGWWFLDHVLGSGECAVQAFWHLHPAWRPRAAGHHVAGLRADDAALGLASTAGLTVIAAGTSPLASRSPAYGAIEPAPVIVGTLDATLPTTVATFISASAETAQHLEIEHARVAAPPGAGWHGSAFRLRWAGGVMTVLAALEERGTAANESSAPPDRWGTDELQTDARVAVLIDHATGRSEAVLVNGAFVDAHSTHRLVDLPRRMPLLRMNATGVAPGVHEVGAGHE
jgi:hypothetical protein